MASIFKFILPKPDPDITLLFAPCLLVPLFIPVLMALLTATSCFVSLSLDLIFLYSRLFLISFSVLFVVITFISIHCMLSLCPFITLSPIPVLPPLSHLFCSFFCCHYPCIYSLYALPFSPVCSVSLFCLSFFDSCPLLSFSLLQSFLFSVLLSYHFPRFYEIYNYSFLSFYFPI